MGRSSKDKRDIFYRLAKEEGWRARSAFKLLQIQQTLNILDGVTRAVDLCAAPGSWSQVLAQVLRPKNEGQDKPYIVAVDLQTMSPIPGVQCIKGDITSEETAKQIIDALGGSKAQIVVCDGAPDVTGLHELDERLQSQLLFAALSIATCILEENGTFVCKFFRASEEGIRFNFSRVKYFFDEVTLAKPRSSRASSMECFIVGRNFRLPTGFEPKVPFPVWPQNIALHQAEIPFLSCGDLSGFDSETTYPLPPDYVYREPVQKPIDPPYAAAVEMRKTEKLSSKITNNSAGQSCSKSVKDAVYSYNSDPKETETIVTKLEVLTINPNYLNDDTMYERTQPASPSKPSDYNVAQLDPNRFDVAPKKPEVQQWTAVRDPTSVLTSTDKEFSDETLNVHLSFRGGLELLFGGAKELPISLPKNRSNSTWTMELLLKWMKDNVIQERPELFIKDDDIRPGILIFINDTDWELLDKLDYELAYGDRISFISTLHGG